MFDELEDVLLDKYLINFLFLKIPLIFVYILLINTDHSNVCGIAEGHKVR